MTGNDLARLLREAVAPFEKRFVGLAVGALQGQEREVHTSGVVAGTATENDTASAAPTGDTLFQIGSITKVFTSLALADAVTRGELRLETTLDEVLPETAGAGSGITLEQLASHTSGLPRLPKGMLRHGYRNRLDPYSGYSTDSMFEALATGRRGRSGRVRYSNFGAALLGQALCRRTGLSFAQLVADRITTPLGMVDTLVDPGRDQQASKATGHSSRMVPVPDWNLAEFAGAGALFSTVTDMMTFLHANIDPDATPIAGALRLAQQPRAQANRWLQVGLGWHISTIGRTKRRIHWHNGGTGGFFSFAAFDPDAAIGVVALTNTARPVDRVGQVLLDQLVPRSLSRL